MRSVVAAAVGLALSAAVLVASAEPPAGAAGCTGCHATSSQVQTPVPRLAGRDQEATARALQDFRSGARPATVMDRIAKGFTDAEIQAIAAWFAGQK
jgi:cytochrome c553